MIGKNLGEIRTRKKRDHTVGYCATFCGLRSGGICDLSPSLTYNDWAPAVDLPPLIWLVLCIDRPISRQEVYR